MTAGPVGAARDASVRRPVVAVDGPASSGKSSVGAAAASVVGYRFCDTGLLYRALAWLALRRGIASTEVAALVGLVDAVELAADDEGRLGRVLVGGREVTGEIRDPDVDALVSEVARVPEVRAALLDRQRALARDGGIVMAGRDIGSVVLPDADLKLYLDASAEERARRRAVERGLDPAGPEAAGILASLRRRDATDRGRAVAPLTVAPDAVVVVTDGLDLDATVARVVEEIRRVEADHRAHSAPPTDPAR